MINNIIFVSITHIIWPYLSHVSWLISPMLIFFIRLMPLFSHNVVSIFLLMFYHHTFSIIFMLDGVTTVHISD